MNKEVFGYLLVTENSLKKIDVIARDYWFSTVEMNKENLAADTNYHCIVVCMNYSWWARRKLSKRTGISMQWITSVKKLKRSNDQDYSGFDTVIATDSHVDDTFWGRIKVFDSEANIPRAQINPCIDVVYES